MGCKDLNNFFVVGGRQAANSYLKGEFGGYKEATICQVSTADFNIKTCTEYISPTEVCPDKNPTMVFKAGTVYRDNFYVPTQTEILIYDVKTFKMRDHISLPCFNDLHHVNINRSGNIVVANTGLDIVLEIDHDGNIIKEWSVVNENTWHRFSREIDYRKVNSTKPHKAHTNFIFINNNDIWATRFKQKDAICLTDSDKKINIEVGNCHDGIVHNNKVYFTCTNGLIVKCCLDSLQVEKIHDLNFSNQDKKISLGWCRGLSMVGDDKCLVGFSRLRPTKIIENVLWVRGMLKLNEHIGRLPTRVGLYNLAEERMEWEVNLEVHNINVIFSIHNI